MTYQLLTGDCREVLATLPAASVDAVVTDPPYALTQIGRSLQLSKNGDGTDRTQQRNYQERGFMGKSWDNAGVAFDPATWAEVLCVTRPGGYLLAFGGTRTYHRLTCAIEDAGWTIVDSIHWMHGQGFPKGQGQLKPAHEPIVLARKPGPRVLPLQIDACRTATSDPLGGGTFGGIFGNGKPAPKEGHPAGRWPPNVAFSHAPGCRLVGQRRVKGCGPRDGGDLSNRVTALEGGARYRTDHEGYADADGYETVDAWECADDCPVAELARQSGERPSNGRHGKSGSGNPAGLFGIASTRQQTYFDTGTAARFFPTFRYCPKAPARERTLPDGERVSHPTQKPLTLMRWLVRLVAAPGATCLDPFAGSGTTGVACLEEGVHFIGVEQDAQYAAEARQRMAAAQPLLVPA